MLYIYIYVFFFWFQTQIPVVGPGVLTENTTGCHLYHRMSAVWVDPWHEPAAAEPAHCIFRHPLPKLPKHPILTEVPSPYLPCLHSRTLTGKIPSRERTKRNLFQTTMFTHPYAIVAPITVPHRSPAVRGRRVNMKWCEVMSLFWILSYVLRSAIWWGRTWRKVAVEF